MSSTTTGMAVTAVGVTGYLVSIAEGSGTAIALSGMVGLLGLFLIIVEADPEAGS